uniref:Uncharacterized protein n=1 Tax=Plectus sambesii TaxID=2011161 RepID=A0A914WX63_9BILA
MEGRKALACRTDCRLQGVPGSGNESSVSAPSSTDSALNLSQQSTTRMLLDKSADERLHALAPNISLNERLPSLDSILAQLLESSQCCRFRRRRRRRRRHRRRPCPWVKVEPTVCIVAALKPRSRTRRLCGRRSAALRTNEWMFALMIAWRRRSKAPNKRMTPVSAARVRKRRQNKQKLYTAWGADGEERNISS